MFLAKLISCSSNICKSASVDVMIPLVKQYKRLHNSEDNINQAAKSEKCDDKIVDVGDNPQLFLTMVLEIYNNLRASEANAKKRARSDYMLKVQKELITADMRELLIDWLVGVANYYKLDSETLYLTVNYIDRYLSGNSINPEKLKLLGVTCMMIASKHENNGPPLAEKFCVVTGTILRMERTVLHFLKFELTVPTIKCFLEWYVCVAQAVNQALPKKFKCMSNYLAELSLLDYRMLGYPPSMIAASSVFLAGYILLQSRPWNSTLQHFTLYKPSELLECVKALHKLFCNSNNADRDKFKYVAEKYCKILRSTYQCPPSIPSKYFQDQESFLDHDNDVIERLHAQLRLLKRFENLV